MVTGEQEWVKEEALTGVRINCTLITFTPMKGVHLRHQRYQNHFIISFRLGISFVHKRFFQFLLNEVT